MQQVFIGYLENRSCALLQPEKFADLVEVQVGDRDLLHACGFFGGLFDRFNELVILLKVTVSLGIRYIECIGAADAMEIVSYAFANGVDACEANPNPSCDDGF